MKLRYPIVSVFALSLIVSPAAFGKQIARKKDRTVQVKVTVDSEAPAYEGVNECRSSPEHNIKGIPVRRKDQSLQIQCLRSETITPLLFRSFQAVDLPGQPKVFLVPALLHREFPQ